MNCKVCDVFQPGDILEVPEIMYRTGHVFHYQECRACSSLYLVSNQRIDETLYPENYYSFAKDPLKVFDNRLARFAAQRLANSTTSRLALTPRLCRMFGPRKELRSLARIIFAVHSALPNRDGSRILDVGSGSGLVPYVLSLNLHLQATGIDPYAEDLGLSGASHILKRDIFQIEGEWGLIMFNHSFEHMDFPRLVLERSKELLAPRGRLLIRIPTVSSTAYAEYGKSWYQIDAPRHTFVPSRIGVKNLLSACGFRIIEEFDDSSSVQFWLSDHAVAGRSLLDSNAGFSRFRRPASKWRMTRYVSKARKVNRRGLGDQYCIVAEVDL